MRTKLENNTRLIFGSGGMCNGNGFVAREADRRFKRYPYVGSVFSQSSISMQILLFPIFSHEVLYPKAFVLYATIANAWPPPPSSLKGIMPSSHFVPSCVCYRCGIQNTYFLGAVHSNEVFMIYTVISAQRTKALIRSSVRALLPRAGHILPRIRHAYANPS